MTSDSLTLLILNRHVPPETGGGLWEQSGGSNAPPSTGADVLTGPGSDGPSEQRGKGQSHTEG